MKIIIRKISIILAIAILAASLFSCGNTEQPEVTESETEASEALTDALTEAATEEATTAENTTEAETEAVREPITTDFTASAFNLITAGGSGSSTLSTVVTAILTRMKSNTSLNFKQLATSATDAGANEILIGKTNRPESRQIYEKLRSNDYTVAVINNRVVIAGGNDDSLAKAANWFLTNIVAKNKYVFTEGVLTEYSGTYTYNVNSLLGKAIGTFTIVYGKGSNEQKSQASRLQSWLEAYAGYTLEMKDDSTAVSENEIVIGSNSRSSFGTMDRDSYKIVCDNSKVYLQAVHYNGLEGAIDSLISEFEKNSEIKTLDISGTKFYDVYSEKLEGKTIYAIGDSYFAGEGLDPKTEVWIGLLSMKYGMKYENYGKGGSTVSDFITTNNPMCRRISAMAADSPDIVLFEGGANDWNHSVPVGTKDDTSTSTFCGAVKNCIEQLHAKYPKALIICITNWNSYGQKNGVTGQNFANAMIDCAALYPYAASIDATNLDIIPVDYASQSFRDKYSIKPSDINHLNVEGHRYAMPYFEKQIIKLYEDFYK